MVYGYMIETKSNKSEQITTYTVESNINSLIEFVNSIDILTENNIINLNEDSLKSYWQVFITKVREIIRQLNIKIKEFFTKFSKKALDNIMDRELENLKELFGSDQVQKILPLKVQLVVVKDDVKDNLYGSTNGEGTSIANAQIMGTDEEVEASKRIKEISEKAIKLIAGINSEDASNYFTNKEFSINSESDLYKILSERNAIAMDNEKNIEIMVDRLENLEKNLSKLENMNLNEKDSKNNKKLNNYKIIYSNTIQFLKNNIFRINEINKKLNQVYMLNIIRVKRAMGVKEKTNTDNSNGNEPENNNNT